jgi:transcriptional regulator with XRE-family HTH domain
MTIYARIQKLCKRDKITVSKLEKTYGKSRGFYQKWSYAMPNTANLIEVADFFGVSIDFLLGRPELSGAYDDERDR